MTLDHLPSDDTTEGSPSDARHEESAPYDAENGVTRRPLLALDLDGTVRRSKSGGFIDGPDDVELFPDVEEMLWRWRNDGYVVAGVTNQGGVAYGYKTVDQVADEITATEELFEVSPFDVISACCFHPDGTEPPFNTASLYRKPHYGMLATIEADFAMRGIVIDWNTSLVVGDRPEDRAMAEAAGLDFQWAWEFFGREVPDEAIENEDINTEELT